jgi:hypothetical protein
VNIQCLDANGPHRSGRTDGLTGAAPVASVLIHARLIRKSAIRTAHRNSFVGASPDADGAFASIRQQTDVQVHDCGTNHAPAFFRQRKARKRAAGTDLVAAVAILAAVILVEAQPGSEEARHPARAEVRLNDFGWADLGAVAAPHTHARKALLVK